MAFSSRWGWEARIRAINFRNRPVSFLGDALYFWSFSEEGILPGDLPLIDLSDTNEQFSKPLRLEGFVKGLPAKQWAQVRIPLQEFESGSLHSFQPERTDKVVFVQGSPDSAEHTLIVDEIKIDQTVDSTRDVSKSDSNLPAPRNTSAESYERQVDIRLRSGRGAGIAWANQGEAGVKYRQGWSHASDGERYGNGHKYFGVKLDVGVGSGGGCSSLIIRTWGLIHAAFTTVSLIASAITGLWRNLAYRLHNPWPLQRCRLGVESPRWA